MSTETNCRRNSSKREATLVYQTVAMAPKVGVMVLLKIRLSQRHNSTTSSRVKMFGAGLRQGDVFWLYA